MGSMSKTSKKRKIAFQGELGANSHIACNEAYPGYEPLPCPTFEDALAAIAGGRADLGMIPIENSVAGRVADIHHLMPTAKLHIIAEHFLPIRNQLMAPYGATLKGLKTVESHIMALGQCRNYIRKLGIKALVAADTAGAAKEGAEHRDPTRGAIAPRRENLRLANSRREHRGRLAFDHALHRALAREEARQTRQRPDAHDLRVPGAQHSGRALQGARRLCHQSGQHDQARKLHDRG